MMATGQSSRLIDSHVAERQAQRRRTERLRLKPQRHPAVRWSDSLGVHLKALEAPTQAERQH